MKLMMVGRRRALLLTLGVSSLIAMPAMAGGFSRGEANTDMLFNEARFGAEASYVYVSPDRSYSSLMGQPVDEDSYSDEFRIPNIALGMRIGEDFSCALTYTKPFGASATYSAAAQLAEYQTAVANGIDANPTSKMKFSSEEFGATCDMRFDAGPGRLHMIGGAFVETFEYAEDTFIGNVRLKDDGKLGYRLGLAYDIPEYALRVQLMYRSQIKHEGDGTFTASADGLGLGIPGTLPANGAGTLPQSVKLYAQTGIAPGWLAYGSIAWTDWSVLPNFNYTVTGLGTSNKVFNYTDGYTVQLGVGHEFNDKLSGTVNITWDEGVGTGADITTDSWTLGLGAQYKATVGTIGVGAAVTYLTAGSQSASKGATYDAEASADWAVAAGVSYKIEF
ncbi:MULTISPECIES: OmpP1/FadL family transporter [Rhizobium]|uniref:Long-chain fatty acid transporter n=1 Tax=Rhizobium wuzhouense TaxID=1986026 RepID=A0ABX5NLF2_9HYPH|nr:MULTISPECIES: outer membrane protein transport protein [Rhizobium]PYB69803.1 long-chain fatty acid transporter [Rhizobium wuzhouense]RKE79202.1 long-chain fatty acid transport protein [Rhizobium sp. AG855]